VRQTGQMLTRIRAKISVMSRRARVVLLLGAAILVLLYFLHAWETSFRKDGEVVVYFGRPHEIATYFRSNWRDLLRAGSSCLVTATASLVLAGMSAIALLLFGLRSDQRLRVIEKCAAVSQTIPMLVIVTISLLVEQEIFKVFHLSASADWYCLVPVTLALMFPPLVNGVAAMARMPIQFKALFRIWNAPTFWRIWRIYLPFAIPDVLAGLRTSGTWAVGALLITEGLLNGVEGDSDTLGHFLLRPFSSGPAGRTPAAILVATALGFAVYYLFTIGGRIVEARLYGRTVMSEGAYPLQTEIT
jgi:NitT/TauT family transport system permease protein